MGQQAKLGLSIVLKGMLSHTPTKNKGEGFVYPILHYTNTILFINSLTSEKSGPRATWKMKGTKAFEKYKYIHKIHVKFLDNAKGLLPMYNFLYSRKISSLTSTRAFSVQKEKRKKKLMCIWLWPYIMFPQDNMSLRYFLFKKLLG